MKSSEFYALFFRITTDLKIYKIHYRLRAKNFYFLYTLLGHCAFAKVNINF